MAAKVAEWYNSISVGLLLIRHVIPSEVSVGPT